jgi:hypothetical protein
MAWVHVDTTVRSKWLTVLFVLHMVFKNELYNDIRNIAVCQVLRKHLHLKAFKVLSEG